MSAISMALTEREAALYRVASYSVLRMREIRLEADEILKGRVLLSGYDRRWQDEAPTKWVLLPQRGDA